MTIKDKDQITLVIKFLKDDLYRFIGILEKLEDDINKEPAE
jgi:hypothetical protein